MNEGYEPAWRPWLSWSAVWVGALSALAVGLIIGLIGFAIGAHQLTAPREMTLRSIRLLTAIFDVGGAFFAYVAGAWVAARMAGFRRAEPAILHGVIAWLVTVPILLLLAALGSTSLYGGWWGGLAGTPVWGTPPPVNEETAAALRNGAVAAAATLLLGLVGSTLGGWMASGEPMSLKHYRRRPADEAYERPRRAA